MKKSKLRQIIRESIKQLMTEQLVGCPDSNCQNYISGAIGCPGPLGNPMSGNISCCNNCSGGPQQPKKVWFKPCMISNTNIGVTIDRTKKMTINGQTPKVGDIFKIDLGPQDGFWNPSMNGAFVPMRVSHVSIPGFPIAPLLDFDKSNCKTRIPTEPNDPITYAKVAQGGGENGYINKTR